MDKLENARIKINEIDKQMAELFEKRMNAVNDVANYKLEHGLPIFDSSREKEVILKNSKYIEDDIIREHYVNFLQNTMDVSKRYQSRQISGMKVAYSGVEGAFAHIACMKMFEGANYISYHSFTEAYEAVEKGECDVCVLPLENSFAGDVGLVMDLMFSGSLYVNQVLELEVVQNLVAKPGVKKEDVKTVLSHPQAISQCASFIQKHQLNAVEAENTAIAAKEVSLSDDNTLAAIASSDTAKLYNLEIIESNINSSHNNTTRFGAFSRCSNVDSKKSNLQDQFILVFTVKNEAGSLAKTLNIIGSYGFNMRSLRSRPMKELIWNYYFYVELEGNITSEDGKDMLRALGIFCDKLKLVGSYSLNTNK